MKLVTWVVSQALSALPIHRKRRCMRAGQREAGNKVGILHLKNDVSVLFVIEP